MKTFNPTSATDLRNAGLMGHPPFNEETGRKIFDYIRDGAKIEEMSGEEQYKLITKCYYSMTDYRMLYGCEKEEK